jgi:hypothetical protein
MVAIVSRVNTSVVAGAGATYRITKIGGFDDSFDAAAVSTTGFAGDVVLRAKRVGGTTRLMVGLSLNADEDTGYAGLDYSAAYRDGVIEVFERGNYRTYTTLVGDYLWIDRIGTTLRYRCGARRKTADVIRTVTGVTQPLFFDCSLVTPGSAVDVRCDAPGVWSDPRSPMRRIALAPTLAL